MKKPLDWKTIAIVVLVVLASPLWLVLGVLAGLFYLCRMVVLYGLVWGWWIGPRRRRVVFVYSDSPRWKEHIEEFIIPRLPSGSVVLNWSHRQEWRRLDFAVLLFHAFAGRREFNPIGIVFERFTRVRSYRFWQAFRDLKHGHGEPLRKLEAEFLEHVVR